MEKKQGKNKLEVTFFKIRSGGLALIHKTPEDLLTYPEFEESFKILSLQMFYHNLP